jgi:hypothetical protein
LYEGEYALLGNVPAENSKNEEEREQRCARDDFTVFRMFYEMQCYREGGTRAAKLLKYD